MSNFVKHFLKKFMLLVSGIETCNLQNRMYVSLCLLIFMGVFISQSSGVLARRLFVSRFNLVK